MKTRVIEKSESYPKYHLIERDGCLHVAMQVEDGHDGDGYFSVGVICHRENFEIACDNAEEDFRCMAAEFGC
jgi:hypothetical protein